MPASQEALQESCVMNNYDPADEPSYLSLMTSGLMAITLIPMDNQEKFCDRPSKWQPCDTKSAYESGPIHSVSGHTICLSERKGPPRPLAGNRIWIKGNSVVSSDQNASDFPQLTY